MPRPIEALIHGDALANNLARSRRAAADARVFAVVKADAYGHGIERVFAGLRGADGFALLDLDEALRLRQLDWRGPILLLEGCFEPRDLEICSRLDLWTVVHREEQIDWLAAHKTHRPLRVFLKMNTGMNRLGFRPAAFREAWTRLNVLPQVDEISLMTHFANADVGADSSDDRQDGVVQPLAVFESTTADLPGERCLANSAATLKFSARDAVRADWVRAGILLYGSSPDHPVHSAADWGLSPTMTLRSRLIAVQTLATGEAVGYGGSHVATVPQRVGVVACGYADGYPRHAGSCTPVLVNGVRCTTVGRVSMDMLAVDLAPVPMAEPGAEVTLWGRGPGEAVLPIDEVAQAAGTIGYELLCALARRVPVREG
jgi:alanine racemase